MSRALDPKQQAELTEFVNDLAKTAGYTTTAEWARDSGYPAPNLSKLRGGKGAIDGYNLLRLIRVAAARAKLDPLAISASATAGRSFDLEPALQALRAQIEGHLEEAADLAAENFDLIRDRLEDVARRLPDEGAQAQKEA